MTIAGQPQHETVTATTMGEPSDLTSISNLSSPTLLLLLLFHVVVLVVHL